MTRQCIWTTGLALRVALGIGLPIPGIAIASPVSEPVPLTAEEALRQLDAQNLTLAQARSRAQEAKGVVRQAMAAFLPALVAGGSYTRNSDSATLSLHPLLDSIEGGLNRISPTPVRLDRTNVPDQTVIQPLEAFTGQASVRVPLFAANAYSDWQATKEAASAAEASIEVVRLQLRAALIQSASWSGAAEEIAAASERALAIALEHEKSAARNVEAGVAAPLSHLQARTEVVRRENDVVRTRADKERAWLALGVLLGKADPVRVVLPADEALPSASAAAAGAGDVDSLTRLALEARPELRVQQASMKAAERQLDSAWWRHAPQLSASFAAFASNVVYPTGDKAGWRASVDLAWTLYDGGFRYGKRAQAAAQIVTAQAAWEAQRIEISQQVKDSARDVDVASERLRLAKRQRELAQEVFGTAKRSFEAGLASSLDVLDANDRLYQADVGLADARARLGMARTALARATGSLL
ncbi:MAG: TolC family protein [Deltaproteobacteria bacterium]|nr:TolC family protein [Deltaproteobacteria bacterium]